MDWLLKKKIPLAITFVGALAGFLYWNYIGCASGNCGITANWHTSMGFGAVMGWLVGDIFNDKLKTNNKDEN